LSKNAEQQARNWVSTDRAALARPRLPRLAVILGLALLAWAIVIGGGFLGWTVIARLLGF
jgi:hypothetical protein